MTQVVDFPTHTVQQATPTRLKLQQNRQIKRRKIWWLRLQLLLRLVLFVATIGLTYWFWTADFWCLKPQHTRITHHGSLLKPSDIKAFVQPLAGQALYQLDPQRLAAQFKQQYPIVHQIWFRRWLFPSRLEVEVSEQTLWARVSHVWPVTPHETPTVDAWLSVQGSWLPVSRLAYSDIHQEIEALPLVSIIAGATPWLQNVTTIRQLMLLHHQLLALPLLHLDSIDVRNPSNIVAHFKEVDLWLGELNDTLTHRLQRVVPTMGKILELQSQIDRVDLRWDNQITFHKLLPTNTPLFTTTPTQEVSVNAANH